MRDMPWAQTDGRRYFYESRRVNGRQTKFYRGTGAVAEAAAAEVERRKARRAAAREALASFERDHEDGVAHLDQLATLSELLTHSCLLTAGFHRHNNGPWRFRTHAPRPC
jgi:hypothetical protein